MGDNHLNESKSSGNRPFISCSKHNRVKTFTNFDDISRLAANDFAFVKRSSGKWHLAVVVETSSTNIFNDKYIKFLFDIHGHVKTIPAHQWTKLIRLVRFPSGAAAPMDPEGIIASVEKPTIRSDSHDMNVLLFHTSPSTTGEGKVDTHFKRHTPTDTHQRAFISALASIDLSPRSARARVA